MAAIPEGLGADLAGRPGSEFPASTLPTTFADGLSSYARGDGVIKMFFYRTDPNMFGRGGSVANPFLQVVVPLDGFVRSAVLLQRALKGLIDGGFVTEERIKEVGDNIDAINTDLNKKPSDG